MAAKKDLLERLTHSPTDGLTRRADPGESAPGPDLVQTRVNRRVVRRRPAPGRPGEGEDEAEQEEVAASPVVRRRRPTEAPAEARPPAEKPAEEAPAAEQAVETRPEPEAKPPEPAPTEKAPAVEATPAAEEKPPVEEKPAPAEAAPEVAAEAPAAPEKQAEAKPAPAAPAEEPVAAAPGEEDREIPDRPKFEGLGKAVVMPPPGYDPTNPHTWRRQEQERQQRRVPAQPSAPAAAPAEGEFRGRRRVASGPDYRGDRRGARTPAGGRGGGPARRDGPMRRKTRRGRGSSAPKAPSPTPAAHKRKIRVDNVISVSQLAHEMGVKASQVIKELLGMGQMATANEMLDVDTATLVAAEFEYQVENVGFQEEEYLPGVEAEDEENLQDRPPVVTIMGHVDHGKTTLLDGIRDARVAAGEAGGITQHIGAYQVEKEGRLITFIDTPGHAAFTEMRARGAGVTDIVVLVVAVDDGVQPQTEEAISHAKAAGVPIVVAINKMDKAGANPDQIKTKLSDYGLAPEDWGGETLYAEVSALKRTGIDDLLEQLLLQADVLELTANPDRPAEGIVIESKMERGRGAVASVLVQKGTLRRNDHVVLGATYGKVRAMVDYTGQRVKEAGPSTPVEIFGLNDLPNTGDVLTVVKTEKDAKTLAEHRADQRRQEEMSRQRRRTAEDLFAMAQGEEKEVLNIILKCDVQGSLEALKAALEGQVVQGTEVRILLSGVGAITESDVNLAAANDALLIAFNVNVGPNARQAAASQGIEPESFDVIYGVLDRVKALLTGMLAPEYHQVRRGSAEVRQIFKISRVGTIAGSYVLDGFIGRNHSAKVLRDGEQVWEGKISQLKRFKDDVREVRSGFECGISLEGFDDIREGDVVETFSTEEIARTV